MLGTVEDLMSLVSGPKGPRREWGQGEEVQDWAVLPGTEFLWPE